MSKDFRISIIRKKTKLLERYLEWVRMCIGVTVYLNFESLHCGLAMEKWKNTLATQKDTYNFYWRRENRRERRNRLCVCACVSVCTCLYVCMCVMTRLLLWLPDWQEVQVWLYLYNGLKMMIFQKLYCFLVFLVSVDKGEIRLFYKGTLIMETVLKSKIMKFVITSSISLFCKLFIPLYLFQSFISIKSGGNCFILIHSNNKWLRVRKLWDRILAPLHTVRSWTSLSFWASVS